MDKIYSFTALIYSLDFIKIHYILKYILHCNAYIGIKNALLYFLLLFISFFKIPTNYYLLFFLPIIFIAIYNKAHLKDLKFIIFFLTTYICTSQIDTLVIAIFSFTPLKKVLISSLYDLWCELFSLVLIRLLTYLYCHFNIEIKIQKLNILLPIQLLLLSLIVFFVKTATATLVNSHNIIFKNTLILSISSISILSICLNFILYTIILSNKQHYITEKLLNSEDSYYKKILKNNEELRSFKHDIKNHIICLKYFLEEKKLEDAINYLAQIEKHISHFSMYHTVGNSVIDAIVHEKINMIKKNHIAFSIEGRFPDKVNINNYDLCTIFANGLENAIEACQKLENKRFIKIKVGYFNQYLSIVIINSSKKTEYKRTSKKDKINHGYGLYNISKTLEKYDGNLKISQNKQQFELNLLMKYL